MKKLVRLVLFFSVNFAILFALAAGLRFLAIQVEWIRSLSLVKEPILTHLLGAARWALVLALFGSILLSLSYTVRKEVFLPAAAACITVLAIVFSCGISRLLQNWEHVPPAAVATPLLGGPGIILSNTTRPGDTAIVLLKGPADPDGGRVVVTPDKPMRFHREFPGRDLAEASLPPAPFNLSTPWFLRSLAIDLRLCADHLKKHFDEGLTSFLLYTGALVFVLASLAFLFRLSAWPLAGLFIGCFVFRGILALEIYFNTPEMEEAVEAFLRNQMAHDTALPLLFIGIGLLAHLYTFLVYLAKREEVIDAD